MGKQTINVGTTANDGTGSTIRVGGQITNSNFTELYNGLGDGSTISFDLNTQTPTDGQALVYNAASGKFRPGTATATTTFTVAGDGGSDQTITTGADTLTIQGGTGITTTGVATDILSVAIDGTVATLTGTQTLTNKTIVAGSNDITGLTNAAFASSNLSASSTIDVTNNATGAYQFNSHYSGDNPTLYFKPGITYSFNLNVSGHPFHLQTVSGAYSAGNPYTTGLTHVATDGTIVTGASALLKVTGLLFYEVPSGTNTTIYYACQNHSSMQGKIVIGNITDKSNTGDGSTVAFTINSGRTVDDLLVSVNGILLTPTDDYSISGTTLTFVEAPAASSEITIRYL